MAQILNFLKGPPLPYTLSLTSFSQLPGLRTTLLSSQLSPSLHRPWIGLAYNMNQSWAPEKVPKHLTPSQQFPSRLFSLLSLSFSMLNCDILSYQQEIFSLINRRYPSLSILLILCQPCTIAAFTQSIISFPTLPPPIL